MAEKQVLIRPIVLSEKATVLKDEHNQVSFVVAKWANKIEIKRAVEQKFGVGVIGVRTINVTGKMKRMGMHAGRTASWKKAVVTLKAGDRIESLEA